MDLISFDGMSNLCVSQIRGWSKWVPFSALDRKKKNIIDKLLVQWWNES